MSWVIRRRVPHWGHFSASDSGIFAVEEFSPINFISFSVAAAASFRLSYLSNQNAWHALHTSSVTGAVRCASSVIAVISAAQFGQFMSVYIAPKDINAPTRAPRMWWLPKDHLPLPSCSDFGSYRRRPAEEAS